jgi:hypothetical protein
MKSHYTAWSEVERECPRRILGVLHRNGEYVHGTTAARPGKVLCRHRDTQPPPGWQPTPAQLEAMHAASASADDATAAPAETLGAASESR